MFADAEKNRTAENHEYQHALNEAIFKIFTHERIFFPEHHGRAGRVTNVSSAVRQEGFSNKFVRHPPQLILGWWAVLFFDGAFAVREASRHLLG